MFFENTELFNYEKDIIKELENAYKIKCRIYMNIHKNLNNSVLSNYYEHYGSSYNIIKKKELSENVFIDEDDFKELLGNILF